MAELPLDEAIPRFKANEDRVDQFVNGDELTVWTTDDGTALPSLAKLINDKNAEVDNEFAGPIAVAQAAATAASDSATESAASALAADASADLAQEILDTIEQGATNLVEDIFVGTGAQTDWTLSRAPVVEENLLVWIGGSIQDTDDYSLVGTTLTITPAVPNLVKIRTLIITTATLNEITQYVEEAEVSATVAQAASETALAAANAGFVFDTEADFEAATIPVSLDFVRTAGSLNVDDKGSHQKVRIGTPGIIKPWHKQSADGAWWKISESVIIPQIFGGAGADEINFCIEYASAEGGLLGVGLLGGEWFIDDTITLRDGVPLILSPNAVLKRASGFVGTMVRSEDFATYTGTTDATADYPRWIGISGGSIDGRYMNDAFTSYEETSGGNGIEIYAHKVFLDTTVQNIPGIGVWCESSTGNGNLDLDYPRQAKIRLDIQATKYEGLIYKGPADTTIEWVGQTNAGARIVSEQDTGLVSSPTYGGTNGGYTDGVVFNTGAEIGKIHSWGNYVGRGIVINDGRINAHMLMAETCRYGACRILGGYGKIENLHLHRSGGYNGDTQPMLDFNCSEDDGQIWKIDGVIFHKNTSATTPRNLVELKSAGRGLKANFDLVGDNVPGHGVVIDGSYNFLDLYVTARKINGTAPDANAASAIFRTASFSTRSYRMSGYFRDCDVVFRSSGTPEAETLDFTYDLETGQLPFAGDVPTNAGQDWRFNGTVNAVAVKSKNKGASAAINSNITTEQTVTIAHGLMSAPSFGKYAAIGLLDTVTSMSTSTVLQYMYVQTVDSTNITVKVKFSTASGTDTAPRVLWQAEV